MNKFLILAKGAKEYVLSTVDSIEAMAIPGTSLGEAGSVDLGGIIMLGIAFIMAGLSIRFSSMLIDGFAAAWEAANDSAVQFTGLTDVIEFGPTIIILGYIIAVGVVGFLGVKKMME